MRLPARALACLLAVAVSVAALRGQGVRYAPYGGSAQVRALEGTEAPPLPSVNKLKGPGLLKAMKDMRGKVVVLGFIGSPQDSTRREGSNQARFVRKLKAFDRKDTEMVVVFRLPANRDEFDQLQMLKITLLERVPTAFVCQEWTKDADAHKAYRVRDHPLVEPLFFVIGPDGIVSTSGCTADSLEAAVEKARISPTALSSPPRSRS